MFHIIKSKTDDNIVDGAKEDEDNSKNNRILLPNLV